MKTFVHSYIQKQDTGITYETLSPQLLERWENGGLCSSPSVPQALKKWSQNVSIAPQGNTHCSWGIW